MTVADILTRRESQWGLAWLRQPITAAGLMLVMLVAIVIWQHPIARMIGTEQAAPQQVSSTAITTAPHAAFVTAAATSAVASAHTWSPLPNVKPRNPFTPLLVAAATPPATSVTSTTTPLVKPAPWPEGYRPPHAKRHPVAMRHPVAGCATSHTVQPGESLWSIASDHLATSGFGSVDHAWHALYAANRATVGADPGMLHPGEHLCLPPPP